MGSNERWVKGKPGEMSSGRNELGWNEPRWNERGVNWTWAKRLTKFQHLLSINRYYWSVGILRIKINSSIHTTRGENPPQHTDDHQWTTHFHRWTEFQLLNRLFHQWTLMVHQWSSVGKNFSLSWKILKNFRIHRFERFYMPIGGSKKRKNVVEN